jgi:thiol-disulfide isomerase/thioredoxin
MRAHYYLPVEGTLPEFKGGTEWLNSKPLSPEDLKGNVVLVNFWTYTCVNWLRTLPYVRAWAEKYGKQGLVVIGVHTPEFTFEHSLDNVQRALQQYNINYPIVVDNKYSIWSAFNNHFWPASYITDRQGNIRYHQFGEGEYEMAERALQQLLAEGSAKKVDSALVKVAPAGLEVAADWSNVQSPESYLGYGKGWGFASPGDAVPGRHRVYEAPSTLELNQWALAEEASVLNDVMGSLSFQFHARDVNLVMGPLMRGAGVAFRVLLDGKPPGDAHGTDTDADGKGIASEQRTYQLVRATKAATTRRVDVRFMTPGIAVYCITFG